MAILRVGAVGTERRLEHHYFRVQPRAGEPYGHILAAPLFDYFWGWRSEESYANFRRPPNNYVIIAAFSWIH